MEETALASVDPGLSGPPKIAPIEPNAPEEALPVVPWAYAVIQPFF